MQESSQDHGTSAQNTKLYLHNLIIILFTDQIVMTPGKKTANSTIIVVERRPVITKENQENLHVAGGAHKGIVINKNAAIEDDPIPPELSLEFCVYLISAATKMHTKESRQLRFWFKEVVSENEQPKVAQDFFKKLVAPFEFPRDYVGFIKKIMKLMQHEYPTLRKIEVELKQLGQSSQPPPDTGIIMTFYFVLLYFPPCCWCTLKCLYS